MAELMNYFRYLNEFNWGNGIYQWLFYASIVIVLIFEKKKIARIIFGWLPLAFLVAIYNPIFNYLIRIIFPNPDPYYVRMFSFIPVTYGIGVGIMQLLLKTKKWIKLLSLLSIAIAIVLTNTSVYNALGMTVAANPEKVPTGLLEVVAALKTSEKKNICVAVPSPLNTSIRQVDAEIITPYGRDDSLRDNLLRELSQPIPNVSVAMAEAGKKSVDFIVVHRSEECKEAFKEKGYEPWKETQEYMIYAVLNVPRVIRVFDDKRRVVSVTNVDASGISLKNSYGYYTIAYEYDTYGYRCKETYLDINGRKYTLPQGNSSLLQEYSFPSGLIVRQKCLDDYDKPVLVNGRYETRYTYNREKRLVQEMYYDNQGYIMNREDLQYASRKIDYNEKGQISRESYYGTDGNLVLSSFGYAIIEYNYDGNGRVIVERYFDADEKPIKNKFGYASFTRNYNEQGNIISETYYNEQGNKAARDNGYAEVHRNYDEASRITSESYWDEAGDPYTTRWGYHAITKEYDIVGNVISEMFWDNSDNPALYDGYHRIVKNYDRFGNIIEERTYGIDGKLVLRGKGYAIVRREWNEQNQLLSELFFDTEDKPVNNP